MALEGLDRGRKHSTAMRFRRVLNVNILFATLVHLRCAGGFWQLVALPGASVGKQAPCAARIGRDLGCSSVTGRVPRPAPTSRCVLACRLRLCVHDKQQRGGRQPKACAGAEAYFLRLSGSGSFSCIAVLTHPRTSGIATHVHRCRTAVPLRTKQHMG